MDECIYPGEKGYFLRCKSDFLQPFHKGKILIGAKLLPGAQDTYFGVDKSVLQSQFSDSMVIQMSVFHVNETKFKIKHYGN